VDKIWCKSLAAGLHDPTTNALRCLCLEGRSLYQLYLQICRQTLIIETHALLLYGKPSDLTQRQWPENVPTFAVLKGVRWICVSITTWNPDDDDCNIFRRFREYDEKYSKGSLEKVVVRVTQEVIAKVCEAYDECHWPKGKEIIEFRFWDIGKMSPDDAIAREFRDGTWCDCVDSPEVLGPKHTIGSLRDLAKTDHPTSPPSGGFRASPSLHQTIAPNVSRRLLPNPKPMPLSIPPIRPIQSPHSHISTSRMPGFYTHATSDVTETQLQNICICQQIPCADEGASVEVQREIEVQTVR